MANIIDTDPNVVARRERMTDEEFAALPCRQLTYAECELVARICPGAELPQVREYMQDPNYCPFHELAVHSVEELIVVSIKEGWRWD